MKVGSVVTGFIFGAATGILVSWKFFEKHYEKMRQEDFEKCRADFRESSQKLIAEQKKFRIEEVLKSHDIRADEETTAELMAADHETFKDAVQKMLEKNKYVPPYERHFTDEELPQPENEPEYPEDQEDDRGVWTISPEEQDVDPEIIEESDFGSDERFDLVTYYYYADGVLADSDDQIITDIEGTVGQSALDKFQDGDVEEVYVKAPRILSYVEILADQREFSEMLEASRRHR